MADRHSVSARFCSFPSFRLLNYLTSYINVKPEAGAKWHTFSGLVS
jgi:hypothetical protein